MDTYEGEEIVVTARAADTAGGGGGGGGWGGWGGGAGGGSTGGFGGGFGGGGGGWDPYADPFGGDDLVFVPDQDIPAEATNPLYEEPQPETFLPYTVEQHPDGTVVVREYDFWTGQSNFVSIGPDGDYFTGSAPFDVNDWSNTPYLNFPDDGWSLAWA